MSAISTDTKTDYKVKWDASTWGIGSTLGNVAYEDGETDWFPTKGEATAAAENTIISEVRSNVISRMSKQYKYVTLPVSVTERTDTKFVVETGMKYGSSAESAKTVNSGGTTHFSTVERITIQARPPASGSGSSDGGSDSGGSTSDDGGEEEKLKGEEDVLGEFDEDLEEDETIND